MGGYGSSRWRGYAPKTTVEACRVLGIGDLAREGVIVPDQHRLGSTRWYNAQTDETTASIGWQVETRDDDGWMRLFYTITPRYDPEAKRSIDYNIPLVTTRPHFGGLRWWFICPGRGCGKRVAKLYEPPGNDYFLCRTCHDLVYRSSQEHDKKMDRYKRMSWEGLAETLREGEGELGSEDSFSAARAILERMGRLG